MSLASGEIHKNKPYQGEDADIFASFVILFAMRTLEFPFEFAISTGLCSDKNYFYLQSGDTSKFWSKFVDKPSAEFKDLFEVMM